ncbi:MAG: NAD-dependent epimerase/dehydratase family protein [Spirochaetota bacterium]|nr:MAG: NAD-dependent epimerase/dehydratase family protein [Spirochaetota bacterium]
MSTPLNILITGANGFVGSHLLRHLSENQEYRVTGLVRPTSNLFRLRDKQHRLVFSSINDPMEETIKGFDVVIHTAASTMYWGNSNEIYRTNVDGTLNLVEASIKAGVRRFIHFGSTVVYGFDGNINTDESSELKPFKSGYCRSKAIAEEQLLRFKKDIELIILRPSNIFGPEDTVFTYLIIRALDKGILFAFPKAGESLTSPCYVKNIVSATEKTLKIKEGLGEAYNISDGNDIQWKTYLAIIACQLGKKPPRKSAPVKPLLFASRMLESTYTLLRIRSRPPITPHDIVHVSDDYSFSIEKAKTKLDYNPSYTTEEGIAETVQWYRKYRSN